MFGWEFLISLFFVGGLCVGRWYERYAQWQRDRKVNPYQWKCDYEGCYFVIKGNVGTAVDFVREDHVMHHG